MPSLSEETMERLILFGPTGVRADLAELSLHELTALEAEVKGWPLQREAWSSPILMAHEPFRSCSLPEPGPSSLDDVGCIILAGGQGTRLGLQAPKGTFMIRGKSLFEHLLDGVIEKGRFVAIMTSPGNQEETIRFFAERDYLGLTNLHFFSQGTLPLFDRQGRWFWDRRGHLAEGPDGNGALFVHFVQSGLAPICQQQGINLLQILAVDNVLGCPFDGAFLHAHRTMGGDMTLSAIERRRGEAMGLLVQHQGQLRVAEYSEIDPSLLEKEEENGALLYAYGNGGRWVMNRLFMEKVACEVMPLHWADKGGVWKGERFIFDALRYGRGGAVLFPRERSYAPLKRLEQVAQIEAYL